ncbi:MAG: hypothetical protein JSW00_13265 [Thermoplasmata archaeon]|nr:MAG: hypothetical protein JSW00_13265 [Thermoplasmata archaeon]
MYIMVRNMAYPETISYNCPYCGNPFMAPSSAGIFIVNCPICRGQVQIGPMQPHQQYQMPYPPPPTQTPGVFLVIAVVAVAAILLFGVLAYILAFSSSGGGDGNERGMDIDGGGIDNGEVDDEVRPGAHVTAEQLFDDWDLEDGTFESLDDGDTITIRDTIYEMEYISGGGTQYGNVHWTIITFESTETALDDFYEGTIEPSDIFGLMIFGVDITDDFEVGDKVDVEITIVDYRIEGMTAELPEWYVGIMDAYQGEVEYEDIEFPNKSVISHTP